MMNVLATLPESIKAGTVTPAEAKPDQLKIEESLCSVERLEVIAKYAYLCANLEGEMWELGVYRGGSAQVLAHFARQQKRKVRLFDSFAGLPEPVMVDDCGITCHGETIMKKGEWSQPSIELIRSRMPEGLDYEIHQGFVPDTLVGHEQRKISLAHIDLDLYIGTRAALEFLYPRMCQGGVILVDDYDYPRNPGVQLAVRESKPGNYRIWSECEYQAVLKRNVEYVTKP